jgi:cullin-associated NEDD8-dissociated protein 1
MYSVAQVPNIVKALHHQMKDKSIKTRQGCFSLRTELILVLPGAIASHMALLVPGVQFSLASNQSNSNMKIDTLSFVQALLSGHHPTVFHPHAAVITAVSDTFYKISSEALVVLQLLVKVLRPLGSSPFDFTLYTANIYSCCFARLKAQDIDQEVKEQAISCMGQVVAHHGDSLQVTKYVLLNSQIRFEGGAGPRLPIRFS